MKAPSTADAMHRFLLPLLAAAGLVVSPTESSAQSATFLDFFGTPGTGDGQFVSPADVTVASSGEVYVTEANNDRVQRFSSEGAFPSKFGTRGTAAGQFHLPYGICTNPGAGGDVFVGDRINRRVQRFGGGEFHFFEAQFGSNGGADGQFSIPTGICHNPANNQIYVADADLFRVQRFSTDGIYLGKWGSEGSGSGQFEVPYGVAANRSTGQIYVADGAGNRIQRFSATGAFQMAWGSSGIGPGQFDAPRFIEIDGIGLVYVVDSKNDRVQVFNADGRFLYQIGGGLLPGPSGVGVGNGILYISDYGENRIVRYRLANERPTVKISGAKRQRVSGSSLALRGSSRDDLNVGTVEVKVGKGSFRKAKGSKNWIFTARGLKPGINRILVRATDLAGTRSKVAAIRVVRG